MIIVPVIDIARGQVVHAKRGERAGYKPVQSQLCVGSDPLDIVQAFLDLIPFETIYIADLDAIAGNGNNEETIESLFENFPAIKFWIDNGGRAIGDLKKQTARIPVIGSETGITPPELSTIRNEFPGFVLSMDFKNHRFIGSTSLLETVHDWPDDIIAMNLSLVGSNLGPDFQLMNDVRKLAGNRRLYCGGGIRNFDDLQRLYHSGTYGALLATALHNGDISGADIKNII